MSAPRVRPAREDELDRLIEIHAFAYPDDRGHDDRRRNFMAPRLGTFDDLRVVESDGRVVGHGFLFDLSAWLGGEPVRTGGIASIAIAPEARGRGLAGALVASLHAEAASRGAAMTLLFAFREGFYARLGWVKTAPFAELRVDARALSRRLAFAPLAGDDDARVVPLSEVGRDAAVALHREVARAHAGWLARGETAWDRLLADERRTFLALVRGGALAGYASTRWHQPEVYGRATLAVGDLVARDAAARVALLRALGGLADQADDVTFAVAADDALASAFLDAPGPRRGNDALEHPLGALASGPMVRATSLAALAEARGYADDGEVALRVVGTDGKRGAALRVRRGRAEWREADAPADALVVTEAALASMLAAGLRASDAVALGAAFAPRAAAVAELDALFAGPRFHCPDAF